MNNQEDQNRQSGGGSGSAENRGESRKAQLHTPTSLNEEERKKIADEAGTGKTPIADLKETGGMSGRDDAAGGSNDGMEDTSTAKRTPKM